jgi:hypothetical protein
VPSRGRRALPLSLAAAIALGPPGAARAGAPLTLPHDGTAQGGKVLRWDLSRYLDHAVPFLVNPTSPIGANPIAPPGADASDRVAAVRAGFQAWDAVPDAALRFRYLGETADSNALDLRNVVSFSPVGFSFPPAFPGGVFPIVSYALGPGPVTLDDGSTFDAGFGGEILDVDLVVDPQGQFTLDVAGPPPFGVFDLQGIVTHEVGHLAGIEHDAVAGTTLYGFFTPSGGYFGRTLEAGDRIALASLYPEPRFLASTGRVQGTVTRPGGAPVFGAHVLAISRATGVVAASAYTGLAEIGADGMPSRFARGSGAFLLTGLAPGVYDLVAEPLDGPGLPYLNGVFGTGSGGASFVETNFAPGSALAAVTVAAGGLVSGASIVAGPRDPAAPNLAAYAYGSSAGGPYADPAQFARGAAGMLSLGSGENLVAGGALVSGLHIVLQGGTANRVLLGTPSADLGIALPLSVAADAAPGPRLLVASTPNGVSTFAGGVIVVPALPDPDGDLDGTPDAVDACPGTPDRDQADSDRDAVGDACDVCPTVADPGQLDRGGVGAGSAPDGVGDACQCGDVSGDGSVTVADAMLVARSLLQPPTASLPEPGLCDVAGSGPPDCTLLDAVVLRGALLSPPAATILPRCVAPAP